MNQLVITALPAQYNRIAIELTESKQRLALLGVDSETIELIMNICLQHRRPFDLVSRLAQIATAGFASPLDIKLIHHSAPGIFANFPKVLVEAMRPDGIKWSELAKIMNPSSIAQSE